jgi:hypothetical protein
MKIKLVGKVGQTKDATLFELDLAMLVLLYCYGQCGFFPKNVPLHAIDLFVDGKLMPWPDDLSEVF